MSEIKLDPFWQNLLLSESEIISIDKLKTITSIRVYEEIGEKTNTLMPIFFMPNLVKLTITRSYSLPVDLMALSKLPNLRDLRIPTCDVTNTEGLKELNQLEILNISQIKLKTALLKCINDFENLKSLNVTNTELRSMGIFKNNDNIEKLICSYSKGINNMSQLKNLCLLLRDQINIINCPNLKYLRISRARKMTNVDNLINLISLSKLEIINPFNKINLSTLHELKNLEELFLGQKLDLTTIKEPIENVKRLVVLKKDEDFFKEKTSLLKDIFPCAEIDKYKSFINFIDQ